MKNTRLIFLRLAILVLACGWARLLAQQAELPVAPEIAKLEAAVQRNPFDLKRRLQLGLAYMDRGNLPHAADVFREAVKLAPASAEAHNWLGVALMGRSDLPGAVAELRKAVSLDPKYARAYANLGSALAKSGDLDEAVNVFQKALQLEPENLGAQMNLGLALRERGDAEGALLHLRKVAKAEPNNATIQYELGQTLRQKGDLAGSVQAFEKALKIDPELPEGYYGLGLALKQQSASHKLPSQPASPADQLYKAAQETVAKGDLEAAREQLIQALQADDNHAQAHNLLGYILGQQGNLEFALNHLARAVQLQLGSADAHYNYGVALWYSGSKDKSIAELRESVQLDPGAGASQQFLGNALRDAGDLAGARQSLQCAIALLPPTTATYIDLGIVFLLSGELDRALGQFEAGLNAPSSVPTPDWDTAVAKLRDVLAKHEGRADAHNMLGLLLGRKGADGSEVLTEFREAVRLRPDYAQAHNNIGLVFAQSDQDEKAILEFREAIRTAPNYADAHANLGATLMPTDVEQAVTELEKAVSLAPTSVKAQFNLAQAYGASPSRGPAKQIEQLRKVITMSPNFARAHLALGKALLQDGKAPEAVNDLQEATRLEPQSGEAHYQLGLALARAGKQQEATAEVQKGRELSAADERNQNATLDITEGKAALDKGELEQAAAKFQHAVKLAPQSPEAQHYLGVVLEKQGDTQGATAAYRKALDLNPGDVSAKQRLNRLEELPDSPVPNAKLENSEDDPAKIAEFEGYIRESRFKEVEPLLAEYVQQNPKSSWGWYALGYSQFAQKKVGASIQSLAKSLQLDIKNVEAHKILGRDLMIIGRFDAAQTEFEQGIRYDPQSAELHYNLGKLFSIQDNWGPARKEFDKALSIDPSYVEGLDALGFALEALGDDAGAVANYQKAIEINEARHGNFASAHVNLSAYYNRTGDPQKALENANKALEVDPKSDGAWFQKGRAEERQGHLNEAVNSVNHAIALNSRSSSYYYVLAGFYRKLGKLEDSRKALDTFTRLDKETNEFEKMRRSAANPAKTSPPAGGERE
jgi:tetratricopeptide (TPR) repeat protein